MVKNRQKKSKEKIFKILMFVFAETVRGFSLSTTIRRWESLFCCSGIDLELQNLCITGKGP